MSNLYQEAIADAKQLKEIAEQNAKNKILEEIAPRIKRLIEAELSEDPDFEEDDTSEEEIVNTDLEAELDNLESDPTMNLDVPDLDVATSPEVDASPDSPIEVSEPAATIETEDGKKVTVNITVEGERRRKARQLFEELKGPRTEYQLMRKRYQHLLSELKSCKNDKNRNKILHEMRKLQKTIIFNSNDESSLNLAKTINKILKENKMSRRTRRSRRLNENAWWLREADDDAADTEEDLGDAGDAGEESGDKVELTPEEAQSAVENLLDDLGLSDALSVSADADAGADAPDDDDEPADDDDDDLDFGDADEYGMGEGSDDEGMMEADDDEYAEGDHDAGDVKEADDDEVIEISESMIRRELAKMRNRRPARRRRATNESRRRRSASRRRMFESEAREMADQFGGGDLGQEAFVEVDEDTLLNALAEELGSMDNAPSGGEAVKQAGHFGGGAAQSEAIQEARLQRRRARQAAKHARLNEAKAKKLQKELNESNLFNAKLLYVNKLMQQHDLNAKQQRAIVEAIDNAKTLREAKLLYTSLTESLRKRAAKSATLNESAVRTGSASKSLRSSAPARSGESLDRWAVLAGIKK
jgi:hypothetical protein